MDEELLDEERLELLDGMPLELDGGVVDELEDEDVLVEDSGMGGRRWAVA